ncbi:MAG: transcriptional repressor [Eubacteriales bacterium]|nr:transcriptional repressor [Eubacteriales bacterium]
MRRKTIQRGIVHKTVQQLDHPNADSVYQKIMQDYPDMGLSTVYRNINILVEEGALLRLAVPGQADRYDGQTKPHYHFFCDVCRRIYDIQNDDYDALNAAISQKTAHHIRAHTMLLEGVCQHCHEHSVAAARED